MPRICIVGCGAIGGLFAAHLARLDDVEVWAYDVSPEHVAAINRDGLRLTGPSDLVAHPRATSEPREIPPCTFGIVATKSTATEAAIRATAGAFADGAVCSVQNGLGNEETIARHVPRVIRGATIRAGRVVEPGVIEVDAEGPTWIGPFEPQPASMGEVRGLAELLAASGLPTEALEDARGAQWTKVLMNASTNGLAALTGLAQGPLVDHPPTRRLISALLHEGLAVAHAQGIAITADLEQVVDESGVSGRDHRPSTLQDVTAHRPTEIDALNGAIGRLGRESGIPTPLNDAIAALISGVQRSWSDADQGAD
jgi:2-dehydropantoate 2-reductase